jgi:major vault protein
MTEQVPVREAELVLAPNEFTFYLDKTKGIVSVVVGPYKHSLSNTDQLVVWDNEKKRFMPAGSSAAIQRFVVIPEGWYCHIKNPATKQKHPEKGINDLTVAGLDIGRKVNISGPDSFALWPGQMVKVIKGHTLRSNQYLMVRVYDTDLFVKALKNRPADLSIYDGLDKIEKPAKSGNESKDVPDSTTSLAAALPIGQLFVVKGTKVHFYIPPDGVEVAQMGNTTSGTADFVQSAITLEQLQYCILQDEDGNKEYVRGPAVVFPKPTQWFVEDKTAKGVAAKKFRAIELNEISGLYIKVIKAYEEGGKKYSEGDELFITGKEQKIYFPRPEHAVIRYDGKDRHHAVIIPEGEGRYVLDRMGGKIETTKGPKMMLPDPRTEVIVRRILSQKQVQLYYPGNTVAAQFNAELMNLISDNSQTYVEDAAVRRQMTSRGFDKGGSSVNMAAATASAVFSSSMLLDMAVAPEGFGNVAEGIGGDEFDRATRYNAPRTLTLDSKYDGVVTVNVWNGYAVMVVKKDGTRRVVEGPTTLLLDYDETLEPLSLSTGTPKTSDKLIETVYLRARNNIVSDVVAVETKDMCPVHIKLSYRVDFDGEQKAKWFDVENYVKFLCDHARSRLKNAVQAISIRDFYGNAINIIRDIILGAKVENGERKGLYFSENSMKVYDVEVHKVQLADQSLAAKLDARARKALIDALEIEEAKARVLRTEELTALSLNEEETKAEGEATAAKIRDTLAKTREGFAIDALKRAQEMEAIEHTKALAHLEGRLEEVEKGIVIDKAEFTSNLTKEEENFEFRIGARTQEIDLQIKLLVAEAEKAKVLGEAVDPQLIATLRMLAESNTAGTLATALGPLAMFEDKDVVELLKSRFGGLGIDSLIERIGKGLGRSEKPEEAAGKKARKPE